MKFYKTTILIIIIIMFTNALSLQRRVLNVYLTLSLL